ncbi:MAG: hypothetical protein FWD25_05270 [Clostridia bacterium]|nr:hypothetical protein [Clostridia bacterium]
MAQNLDKYRVLVLCEDTSHYHFVRGFLLAQGIRDNRQFTLYKELPEGSGSGSRFVQMHFPNAYEEYNRKSENVLLVVVLDIDKEDIMPEDIKEQLNKILKKDKSLTIAASDKLLLVFPKRNIETWFEWLSQEPPRPQINEAKDYKSKNRNAKPTKMGRMASDLYKQSRADTTICENVPASLLFACNAFTSLCGALKS